MSDATHGWIRIQGLEVEGASLGIYPHEQDRPRPLLVDVELWADIARAARSEQIGDTIDYDRVAQVLREVCARRHWPLVETLVETLAQTVLERFPAERVIVTVHKPGAVAQAQVSVRVERARPTR